MSIVPQLIANSLIVGSMYALVAIGFHLIYSTRKFFDLAHGSMAVIGGYGVYVFVNTYQISVWLSVILALIISGIVGFALDVSIYRALRARKATRMVLLVTSLGIFTFFQSMISIFFSAQFQRVESHIGLESWEMLGAHVTPTQVTAFILAIFTWLFIAALLKLTLLGKAIVAVSDDEEVSEIVGINTNKIYGGAVFLGSAIAGLAGALFAMDTGIEPVSGLALILKGIVGAVIGGIGTLHGAFIGSFLLAFIENFGIWKIASEWRDAISFGLLIIFLVFRPQGIFKR